MGSGMCGNVNLVGGVCGDGDLGGVVCGDLGGGWMGFVIWEVGYVGSVT